MLTKRIVTRWRRASTWWERLNAPLDSHMHLLVGGLTVLALILRLHRLDAFTLWGDEWNSIRQARDIGISFNSVPYFVLLRLWMNVGSGEFVLRLPAAILGALVVPVVYFLGKELFRSRSHGALIALLATTSAYTVEYSQQVRFYSLFLLSSTLAFLVFIRYVHQEEHTWRNIGLLIAANILCLLSHALGFVVIAVQIVTYWLVAKGHKWIRLTGFLVGLAVVLVLPHLIPEALLKYPFLVLDRYQGKIISSSFTGPRGIHPTSFAKVPLAFFFYTFGNSVYPLTLWLVVPGTVLCGYLCLRGLWALRNHRTALTLLLVWLGLPPLFLFLGFDTWVPPYFVGAAPKYIIYVIVALYSVLVHGILSHRRGTILLAMFTIGISVISLIFYYYPSWAYIRPLTDWRYTSHFVQQYFGKSTILLHDGRSIDQIDYYFQPSIPSRNLWNYAEERPLKELRGFDRFVFITDDYKEGNRRTFSRILRQLEDEFAYEEGYVNYPLFVYVYQRTRSPGYPVDPTTGIVTLPKEIYGLPFQDLRLPKQAEYGSIIFPLTGSFALSSPDGLQKRTISLSGTPRATELILLSNLTEAGDLPTGVPVAKLTVNASDGEAQQLILHNGMETNDWSNGCSVQEQELCQIAYSWHKRIAMVGRRAYDAAWRDFEAGIFGTTLHFDRPMVPQTVEIRYLAEQGTLHVWGMAFEDRE